MEDIGTRVTCDSCGVTTTFIFDGDNTCQCGAIVKVNN